ncbi:hypothetical protein NA57DRAFT_57236 [Rhizodiscina lignyota]|uniref:Uncharacterized protein n=1 Tax=Rhizodiscina lignyota TaxID=1504668 RepID=A0A9P4IH19_9PEZI|nr:hypothetical protein NA57DRAFT_57236 [Rhizodiscina lignyota]
MADVRAMLRAERAARAAPTKSKPPAKSIAPAPVAPSKKRKASEDDEDLARKRSRPDMAAGAYHAAGNEEEEQAEEHKDGHIASPAANQATAETDSPATEPVATSTSLAPAQPDVDEEEWAAFEREIASLPSTTGRPSAIDAINSGAVISAAPMTAEEVAAQAREELSAQRGRRDAEMEGEKEDAEQTLAEEFEEMDALEMRVKRLRERRESLRKAANDHVSGGEDEVEKEAVSNVVEGGAVIEEVDEEDEEDEEDWDDWRFRAR